MKSILFGETSERYKKMCAIVVCYTAEGKILMLSKNLYVYLSPDTVIRLDYVRIDFESNQNKKNTSLTIIMHNEHNTHIYILNGLDISIHFILNLLSQSTSHCL